MTILAVSKARRRAKWANVSLGRALTMCQTNMEPKKSCLGTFHTTKVEISLSIFGDLKVAILGPFLPSTLVQ